MSRQLPLNVKAYTVLDDNGDGTAFIGPQSFQEQWGNVQASVKVATNVKEATCATYVGAAATPGYFCGATTWGSTGDSTTNVPVVKVGGNVWAVWSGGDPGAQAVLTVTGTRTVA